MCDLSAVPRCYSESPQLTHCLSGCSSTCTVEPGYGCWADRNGEEGKPPPGPDDIVPDTCKKMSGKKRGRDGRIVEEEDDDDGTGRSRKAVHRVDL